MGGFNSRHITMINYDIWANDNLPKPLEDCHLADFLKTYNCSVKQVSVSDSNQILTFPELDNNHLIIIKDVWFHPEKVKLINEKTKCVVRITQSPDQMTKSPHCVPCLKELSAMKIDILTNNLATKYFLQAMEIKSIYLPPVYFPQTKLPKTKSFSNNLNVGLLGEISNERNLLMQAAVAMSYCNCENKNLKVYVSQDMGVNGEETLMHLRSMFKHSEYELIEYEKMASIDNINWLTTEMDICMVVNNHDTFSIEAAHSILQKVPVITGPNIEWVPKKYVANPNDFIDIENKLSYALFYRYNFRKCRKSLRFYNRIAGSNWRKYLGL